MPCVINADFDSMTPQEQARVFRETYWADNITNAEWPVVLKHDDVRPVNKSRLKKKAAGWLVAFSRIIWLNTDFGAAVMRRADEVYREQVKEAPPIPWALLADLAEAGWMQDGLDAWLRPLLRLKSFNPPVIEGLVDHLVELDND